MKEVSCQALLEAANTSIADAVEQSELENGSDFHAPGVTDLLVWSVLVPLLINLLTGTILDLLKGYTGRTLTDSDVKRIRELLVANKCTIRTVSRKQMATEIESAVRRSLRQDSKIEATILSATTDWATDEDATTPRRSESGR